MRTQAFVLALLLAPLAAQDQGTEPPAMPEVGKAAPVIRLNDHTGTVHRFCTPRDTGTAPAPCLFASSAECWGSPP